MIAQGVSINKGIKYRLCSVQHYYVITFLVAFNLKQSTSETAIVSGIPKCGPPFSNLENLRSYREICPDSLLFNNVVFLSNVWYLRKFQIFKADHILKSSKDISSLIVWHTFYHLIKHRNIRRFSSFHVYWDTLSTRA